MAAVPVELPGLGKYQGKLGALAIAPRSVRLKPGKPGQVHFDLDFTVLHREAALFTMQTTAAVVPVVKGGRLLIPLGPDALRSVKPTLSPKAADRLAQAIHARLPRAARMMVPRRAGPHAPAPAPAGRRRGGDGQQGHRIWRAAAAPQRQG